MAVKWVAVRRHAGQTTYAVGNFSWEQSTKLGDANRFDTREEAEQVFVHFAEFNTGEAACWRAEEVNN